MRSANNKKLNSSIDYEDFVPKKYWQVISLSFGTWQDWDYNWDYALRNELRYVGTVP